MFIMNAWIKQTEPISRISRKNYIHNHFNDFTYHHSSKKFPENQKDDTNTNNAANNRKNDQ